MIQTISLIIFGVLLVVSCLLTFLSFLGQRPVVYLYMILSWSLFACSVLFALLISGQSITESKFLDITIVIVTVVMCIYFNYNFALDGFGFKKVTIVSSLKISDIIFRSGNNEGFILETNSKQRIKLLFRYKQFGDGFIGVSPELSKWAWDRWDDNYDSYTSDTYEMTVLPHTGYILSAVKVNDK